MDSMALLPSNKAPVKRVASISESEDHRHYGLVASAAPVMLVDTRALRRALRLPSGPALRSVLKHLQNLMADGGIISSWQEAGRPIAPLQEQVPFELLSSHSTRVKWGGVRRFWKECYYV